VLWDVDGYHGTARPRAARPDAAVTVRLSGDPLGWAWEQDMRLRLEPHAALGGAGPVVVAERLRRHETIRRAGHLRFEPGSCPRRRLSFDEAAVYLRGVIALQEARAGAAGRRSGG
jgi:hypothetical protein